MEDQISNAGVTMERGVNKSLKLVKKVLKRQREARANAGIGNYDPGISDEESDNPVCNHTKSDFEPVAPEEYIPNNYDENSDVGFQIIPSRFSKLGLEQLRDQDQSQLNVSRRRERTPQQLLKYVETREVEMDYRRRLRQRGCSQGYTWGLLREAEGCFRRMQPGVYDTRVVFQAIKLAERFWATFLAIGNPRNLDFEAIRDQLIVACIQIASKLQNKNSCVTLFNALSLLEEKGLKIEPFNQFKVESDIKLMLKYNPCIDTPANIAHEILRLLPFPNEGKRRIWKRCLCVLEFQYTNKNKIEELLFKRMSTHFKRGIYNAKDWAYDALLRAADSIYVAVVMDDEKYRVVTILQFVTDIADVSKPVIIRGMAELILMAMQPTENSN